MKVRMLTHISGYRGGEPWPQAGGIVEVSDSEAFDMIASRQAEPADGLVAIEIDPTAAAESLHALGDEIAAEEVTTNEETPDDDTGPDAPSNNAGGPVPDDKPARRTRTPRKPK